MSNLKRLEQLSTWITYELETTLLDPPSIKVRLRATDAYTVAEAQEMWKYQSRAMLEVAIGAVAEWDLTDGGKAIPIDPETKADVLRPLMSEPVVGRGTILGAAISQDSLNRELFLKN
jgi:hypothetical protein